MPKTNGSVAAKSTRSARGKETRVKPGAEPAKRGHKGTTRGNSIAAQARKAQKPRKSDSPTRKRAVPHSQSKRDLIVDLLRQPDGVSIDDLIKAVGWLPHSVRAALSGLRKRGHPIDRTKTKDGTSVYRLGGDTGR